MNKRLRVIAGLIYGLLFVGLVTQQAPILAMAILSIAFLASGLLFSPESVNLQAERTLSARQINQDEIVRVALKISNQGPTLETLLIEDTVPVGLQIVSGSPRAVTSLQSGETLQLSYVLKAPRGAYHLPGLHALASDHLGLIQQTRELTLSARFLALPKVYKLPGVTVRPRRTRVYPGLAPARKGGPGVEFFGLREYQAGDPLRWINDRVSARHQQTLFVNEFEQERAVDIGLILDCRVETNLFGDSAELMEHSIKATATLVESFITAGNRVGLLIYGGTRNWVQPGYGKLQRERIFRVLAAVRLFQSYAAKELANLPTRLFTAGSQLVLISSLLSEDLPTLISLRAHGYQLLVISPDPIDFETQFLDDDPAVAQAARLARLERTFLLRRLRRNGIRVFEWRVDQPFHVAARYALTRTPAWRINSGVARA
jgi:uncharacterized protein (DUF58 family)